MAELTLTDVRPRVADLARAGLVPVSPAQHLHELFAGAEVTGARAVALREVPFVTMVGLRVQPGSGAAERIVARLGARLPAGCGSKVPGCLVRHPLVPGIHFHDLAIGANQRRAQVMYDLAAARIVRDAEEVRSLANFFRRSGHKLPVLEVRVDRLNVASSVSV